MERSQITMMVALLALASFLVFWLSQEYRKEKRSIRLATHLEIATEIISDQRQDLQGLMDEIERLNDADEVRVMVGVMDEEHQQASHMMRREFRQFNEDMSLHEVDSSRTDTSATVIMKYVNSDGTDTSFTHVRATTSGGISSDGPFSRAALLNIWPQAVFSLLLFGLMILATRMMQRSHQRQQALIAQKNNLISNMTHELKTPVATIAVALEAIQDFNVSDDKEKTEQYLNAARKELSRLSGSVDMVMQLSKIDQEATIYDKEDVKLHALAEEVTEVMRPQLERARMKWKIIGDRKITANMDRQHFRNALINLVDNAVKYGKPEGTMIIELLNGEQQVVIAVQDNGPGIAQEHQSSVFDRFFRVDHGDRHDVKGDGLGLSYVKEVVEAHGGSVALHSQMGKGSRFEISISQA